MTGATLLDDLRACVADPGQVRVGELARHTQAHDASHFLLLPTAVVVPASAAEVGRLLELARRRGVPLTFRSGGTSLSGQGVTDQLLVDVRRHFRGLEILDDGLRVRVDPGVTVGALNARLARYGRRFGPDPASETACTVGGVLANNSSGMACGIVENSYRTLESVVAVLPSGTVIDTGGRDADERLRALEPDLYKGLLDLRMRILGNPASVARVTQQYAMKNTMGYGLNALLDHDDALGDPDPPARRQRGHARLRRVRNLPHRLVAHPDRVHPAGVRRPVRGERRATSAGGHGGRDPGADGCHVAARRPVVRRLPARGAQARGAEPGRAAAGVPGLRGRGAGRR